MTIPSRQSIRHLNPDGLRPSTLPLGHGGTVTTSTCIHVYRAYRVVNLILDVFIFKISIEIMRKFHSSWYASCYLFRLGTCASASPRIPDSFEIVNRFPPPVPVGVKRRHKVNYLQALACNARMNADQKRGARRYHRWLSTGPVPATLAIH